jgi:hypothetical protein
MFKYITDLEDLNGKQVRFVAGLYGLISLCEVIRWFDLSFFPIALIIWCSSTILFGGIAIWNLDDSTKKFIVKCSIYIFILGYIVSVFSLISNTDLMPLFYITTCGFGILLIRIVHNLHRFGKISSTCGDLAEKCGECCKCNNKRKRGVFKDTTSNQPVRTPTKLQNILDKYNKKSLEEKEANKDKKPAKYIDAEMENPFDVEHEKQNNPFTNNV